MQINFIRIASATALLTGSLLLLEHTDRLATDLENQRPPTHQIIDRHKEFGPFIRDGEYPTPKEDR